MPKDLKERKDSCLLSHHSKVLHHTFSIRPYILWIQTFLSTGFCEVNAEEIFFLLIELSGIYLFYNPYAAAVGFS